EGTREDGDARPRQQPRGGGFDRCPWLHARGVAARGRERAGPAHGAARREFGRAPQPRSTARRATGRGEELHAGPGALADGCREWRSVCRRTAAPRSAAGNRRACHRPKRAERKIPARTGALDGARAQYAALARAAAWLVQAET